MRKSQFPSGNPGQLKDEPSKGASWMDIEYGRNSMELAVWSNEWARKTFQMQPASTRRPTWEYQDTSKYSTQECENSASFQLQKTWHDEENRLRKIFQLLFNIQTKIRRLPCYAKPAKKSNNTPLDKRRWAFLSSVQSLYEWRAEVIICTRLARQTHARRTHSS
jgi:hypothetical protein